MKSVLTKSQFKTFTKKINYEGKDCTMSVTLRYDDECNNGYNTFSITGAIKGGHYKSYRYEIELSGCIHDKIKKYFPEFAHLIKWHLCESQQPMYYIENTLYFATVKRDFNAARKSAIWEDATDMELSQPRGELEKLLLKRLPKLMKEFRRDIEALGFIY